MNPLVRLQKALLLVGLAGMLVAAAGALFGVDSFLRAYLMGYLFWLGIALGCLPLLMLHHLVGGGWGFAIRRILESGTRTLPVMALLFLPIPVGVHRLYLWSRGDVIAGDPTLQLKSAYLNVTFFIFRAALYFAVWMVFAYFLNKMSAEQDQTGELSLIRRFQLLSAPGILVYGLTVTFASVDWAMSLEPHWFSTIYGMLFIVGQVLATLAFVIPVAAYLSEREPLSRFISSDIFQDLGNLLLTFVMLWAYLAFSQFLIIWSGNLPEEIPWYIRRGSGGWQWVAALLALFHFAIPFFLLLSRRNKRKKQIISGIAVLILVMRFVDTVWLIKPAFASSVLSVSWLDFVLPVAIGGLWFAALIRQLGQRPLLPLGDPNFR